MDSMKSIDRTAAGERRGARDGHGGGAGAAEKTVALVTNVAADFWTIAGRGLEKAQKEHPDYNIELIVTNEGTAAGQRRELDDLLVRGVAGISISVDDAPHATEATQQGCGQDRADHDG